MNVIAKRLESLEDWRGLVNENEWLFSDSYINSIVDGARTKGLNSVAFGDVDPSRVGIIGNNWRETISVDGCSSRVRAVLDLILSENRVTSFSKILMLEAVTPFALQIRSRFPLSLGVEYLPTNKDRDTWFPIMHCDIENPPFDENKFDLVVSNDVLEHVSDLDAALAGQRKILKDGGVMIATIPFAYDQYDTIEKAKLVNGELSIFGEPEYHGNPVDPDAGSLVYNIPGWDIVGRCRSAGFSDAAIIFVSDYDRAITGAEVAGIHILRAVK